MVTKRRKKDPKWERLTSDQPRKRKRPSDQDDGPGYVWEQFELNEVLKNVADEVERNGPAGVLQVDALSRVIGRPIRIWDSEMRLVDTIGKETGLPIDIQYHEGGPCNGTGHWTLLENKDPQNVDAGVNDCLFAAVASQVGAEASNLRSVTAKRLKLDPAAFLDRVSDIQSLVEMVGGARYNGNSAGEAANVIDNSQIGTCDCHGRHGHPRGHASYPGATGATESVENYSMTGMKTGFLSRSDQNQVGHLMMRNRDVQLAMERLNGGSWKEAVTLQAREITNERLPLAQEFQYGHPLATAQDIRSVVIVMKHHRGCSSDSRADVFLVTLYPRLY